MLSFHLYPGFPSDLFLQHPKKTLYDFLFYPIHATCPANVIFSLLSLHPSEAPPNIP